MIDAVQLHLSYDDLEHLWMVTASSSKLRHLAAILEAVHLGASRQGVWLSLTVHDPRGVSVPDERVP